MAELFLFSIADRVVGKLGSVIVQELGLACCLTNEPKKLKDTAAAIRAVLLDAEEQKSKNNELSLWLERLKDVFYDVDDVLDEFSIRALQQQINKKGGIKKKVRNFFHDTNPVLFSFKMAHKIKKIRAKIDKLSDDKAKFHLVERGAVRREISWDRETHSYLGSSIVIGRDTYTREIIDSLLNSNETERASVIPIVGIGGIGKTTLAKLVFNDDTVVKHFELRIWVCVSEDFNVKQLIGSILSEAPGMGYSNISMEHLVACLQQKLEAKRYLLILDDVWNEDPSKWMELKDLLMMGAYGSKIIVTTRSHIVASVVGTTTICNLPGLPFKDSLTLFHKYAFDEGKQRENLFEIGKDIVKKCKGVPLAIRTLGSLLRTKADESDWLVVRDNALWNLEQRENDILPALRLSYEQLPSDVKHCFAMCSIFPKDYEFNSLEIIYVWIALGLIQRTSHNEEQEEHLANRYFFKLVSRSFFQIIYKDLFAYRFKIHDLMHDLAVSVTRSECSTINENTRHVSENVRFISFNGDNFMKKDVPFFLLQLTNLRTLWGVQRRSETFVGICISRFKRLRLLCLRHSNFEVLPSSIRNLKHLRFLDIIYNRSIKSLPKALCESQCLQVLALENCLNLKKLPKDIGNLISLRCLDVTTQERCFLEKGVGRLTSLCVFTIMDCKNLEYVFDKNRIGQIQFPALQNLTIGNCGNLVSLPWCLRFLPTLENLFIGSCEKLELDTDNDQEVKPGDSVRGGVFRSLKYLGLLDLPKLVILPKWLVESSAETLKHIEIQYCTNFSALPEDLKSLSTLKIVSCPQMTSLPDGISKLHTLTELHIIECPKLTKKYQKVTGEDWHKIAHVPSVYLDGAKV